MNFIEWENLYLNIYLKQRIKEHTYQIYLYLLNKHINPYFINKEMREITKSDITIFAYELYSKNLAPSTKNLIITLIKGLFKMAYENEIIAKNPCTTIKRVKENTRDVSVLSKKDQAKIENYIIPKIYEEPRYLGIILTLYTGIRIGELLALTWENVNLNKKTITVNKTLVRYKNDNNEYETFITEPKTETSKRIIPIADNIYEAISYYKMQKLSNYVISYKGTYVLIRSYQFFFQSVLKKANVNPFNFHVLRHTFATRCIELGIDIKTISELLGHKNATITLNRYSHSLFDTKRKAIKKLSKIMTK